MSAIFGGVGIPWYRRADYPRILEIMEDADLLPITYDRWQHRAEQAERHLSVPGRPVVRVPIEPEKFLAWCRMRGCHVDAEARQLFAADATNWPDKH